MVQTSLEQGIKTEDTLVSELKTTVNLETTTKNLGRECESHYIESNLDIFAKGKDQAKSASEILQVIAKEQEFLGSLDSKIQYLDISCYKNESVASDQQYIMKSLVTTSEYILKQEIIPEIELMKHLTKSMHPLDSQQQLQKICEDHYVARIANNIETLKSKDELKLGEKRFFNTLDYLEFEKKNQHNEYANSEKVQKYFEQTMSIEQQKQRENSFSLER